MTEQQVKRARLEEPGSEDLTNKCINTVRILSADMVQAASSGHPGAPMGCAPIAHVLFAEAMKHNPSNAKWINRDRFVLSNGHGCALLYSMLHLCGFDLTMDDLKAFRQLGSKTPGHPENFMTAGVEVTTGPLGQGIANGVGMAAAQRHMAATYNKDGFNLFDNYTYVLHGDGCHQEGITGEAASLAGHWGLGNLIMIYDDNNIQIDGSTDLAFTEDVAKRYEAYNWHVVRVAKADTDVAGLREAIEEAKKVTDKPSLIVATTTIGFGSTKEGTAKTHGAPLGNEDLAQVKTRFGFDPTQSFVVPADVKGVYNQAKLQGEANNAAWGQLFSEYEAKYPELAAALKRRIAGELPADWKSGFPTYTSSDAAIATRKLSAACLNACAAVLPEIVGGSADLTPSNLTALKTSGDFQSATPEGRYFRFGVREHAMGAICNGVHAYGGFIPFCATFLNFLSYMWPAVRLSALSQHQVLYVMTHDSIGLGEDGPTHQPIEILPLVRACPNALLMRPCDGNETAGCYQTAVEFRTGPSVLCFTRQNVPHLDGTSVDAVSKGAYTIKDCEGTPELIFISSGSEVHLCIAAAKLLGVRVRVVSAPILCAFDKQSEEYRRQVLTAGATIVAVEASGSLGWDRYAHFTICISTFGASGKGAEIFKKFGFTSELIAQKVQNDFLAVDKEYRTRPMASNYSLSS